MATTAEQINEAFVAVMVDFGIPTEFLEATQGERHGVRWTRVGIDLPDGSHLRAWDDDTDVVVQQLTHAEGYEMNRTRLTNVPAPVLVAVLSAFVAESLKDQA
jgi:hypothetical protein